MTYSDFQIWSFEIQKVWKIIWLRKQKTWVFWIWLSNHSNRKIRRIKQSSQKKEIHFETEQKLKQKLNSAWFLNLHKSQEKSFLQYGVKITYWCDLNQHHCHFLLFYIKRVKKQAKFKVEIVFLYCNNPSTIDFSEIVYR